MAIRIECSTCNTIMQVADELGGKRVRCKSCGGAVAVQEIPIVAELAQGFADKNRMPPSLPPARRRAVDEDDADDRRSPRRPRRETSSGSLLPLWIAGGGGIVVLLVIVIVLVARTGSGPAPADNLNPQQPVAQNQQRIVQDQQPMAQNQQPVAAPADRRHAPPLIADPPAGDTMKGEQIYQRLLQSTVWIVSDQKIVANNGNRPFAQFGPPDIPRPFGPKLKGRPPFGPGRIGPGPIGPGPNGPGPFGPGPFGPGGMPNPPLLPQAGQTSNLRGTIWEGSETLPGFGKLRFGFVSDIQVIMVDAKETMRGSFVHTANNVTLTFAGGVVYNGSINGNTMSGGATNGRDNWNWSVTRGGGGGAAPVNPVPGGGIVAKMTGSGSLIDRKHRLVVTNVHVVGKNDNVTIYFPDFDAEGELIVRSDLYKQRPGYSGRVVMREDRADLALVQLERLPDGVQPLTVVKTKVRQAQQVHSVGNPGASRALWVYSPGKVRTVLKDQWKIQDDLDGRMHHYDAMKIETDSAINPGDSGGPLVDDRCALVGVAHGGSLVANNFSFFIEASEVRQILERYYRAVNDKLTRHAEPGGPQLAAR